MSAWALKPFHRAHPKRGRQKQQEEGELGQHPHVQQRRVSGTCPAEATHGEELASEEATPSERRTSSGQAEVACRGLPFHR